MDVTIAICTYGGQEWVDLAWERAWPSAQGQANTMLIHRDSLAEARNEALEACQTEFLIYVDADDQIEEGYVEAMLAGQGDVRAPSVRRVRANGRAKRFTYMPKVWNHRHECVGDCLQDGNWVTVGAMARTELLREVGGWGDEPVYEDFALWLRCWKAGADIQPCPDAVYRYWESPNNRNGALPAAERDEWHWRIHDSIMGAAA